MKIGIWTLTDSNGQEWKCDVESPERMLTSPLGMALPLKEWNPHIRLWATNLLDSEWPRTTSKGLEKLLTFLRENEVYQEQINWADEYGEPGYATPDKGILLANWNNIPKTITEYLEASDEIEIEWSDEWYVDCESCPSKAYRTSPDGYDWTPSVAYGDGFVLTPDSDPSEWIERYEADDPTTAELAPPILADMIEKHNEAEDDESAHWVELNLEHHFESGWHPGQTAKPKDAFIAIESQLGHKCFDVLLVQSEQSQFYAVWTAYFRNNKEEA